MRHCLLVCALLFAWGAPSAPAIANCESGNMSPSTGQIIGFHRTKLLLAYQITTSHMDPDQQKGTDQVIDLWDLSKGGSHGTFTLQRRGEKVSSKVVKNRRKKALLYLKKAGYSFKVHKLAPKSARKGYYKIRAKVQGKKFLLHAKRKGERWTLYVQEKSGKQRRLLAIKKYDDTDPTGDSLPIKFSWFAASTPYIIGEYMKSNCKPWFKVARLETGPAAASRRALLGLLAGKATPLQALQEALWKRPLPTKLLQDFAKGEHSYQKLRQLRNAIYALKQARFRSPSLRALFRRQPWYKPSRSLGRIKLTSRAKKNLRIIRRYQRKARQQNIKHLKAQTWFGTPKVNFLFDKTCFHFGKYQVFHEGNEFIFTRGTPGPACRFLRKRIIARRKLTPGYEGYFRGIAKGHAIFVDHGGSETKNLHLIPLSKGKKELEIYLGTDQVRFDPKRGAICSSMRLDVPDACFAGSAATRKKAARCWKRFRLKHKSLRGKPPKALKCRHPFKPHCYTEHAWKPNNLKKLFVIGKKLSCGCERG